MGISAKESLESVASRLRQVAEAAPITLPEAPGPQHSAVLSNGLQVVFVRVVACGERNDQLSISKPDGLLDADAVDACVRAFFPGNRPVRIFETPDAVHAVESLPPLQ